MVHGSVCESHLTLDCHLFSSSISSMPVNHCIWDVPNTDNGTVPVIAIQSHSTFLKKKNLCKHSHQTFALLLIFIFMGVSCWRLQCVFFNYVKSH